MVEAFKLELIFGECTRATFAPLITAAFTDVLRQVERLNEKFLRSGCLQPRVKYKAGQLADVLASLHRHDHRNAGAHEWSVTPIDKKDNESSR